VGCRREPRVTDDGASASVAVTLDGSVSDRFLQSHGARSTPSTHPCSCGPPRMVFRPERGDRCLQRIVPRRCEFRLHQLPCDAVCPGIPGLPKQLAGPALGTVLVIGDQHVGPLSWRCGQSVSRDETVSHGRCLWPSSVSAARPRVDRAQATFAGVYSWAFPGQILASQGNPPSPASSCGGPRETPCGYTRAQEGL
jgi:hypothetical protein